MTMKDKLASYNHLIETFVIVTETFLCGLLFLLFSKLSNEMQWDSLQVGGTTGSASHAYTDVMLRPLRHPFRNSASPEESAFPSDMETCVREYVPVCPPGRSGPFCRKLCGYSLPVHAGVPFPPVSVSCFVPFHSSSSHQALPYEQRNIRVL